MNPGTSKYFGDLAKLRFDEDAVAPKVTPEVREDLQKAGIAGGKVGGLATGEKKRAAAIQAIEARWRKYYAKLGKRWVRRKK